MPGRYLFVYSIQLPPLLTLSRFWRWSLTPLEQFVHRLDVVLQCSLLLGLQSTLFPILLPGQHKESLTTTFNYKLDLPKAAMMSASPIQYMQFPTLESKVSR